MIERIVLAINFLLVGILSAGCSLPTSVHSGPTLKQKTITVAHSGFSVVSNPALQSVVTSELGDTMISRIYARSIPAVKLTKSLTHDTANNGIFVRLEIPAGFLKKIGEDSNGTFFASDQFYRSFLSFNSREKNLGGIYLPKDPTSLSLVFWSPHTANQAFVDMPEQPVLTEAVPPVVELSSDNQKKELIYTGASKNVISLLYREYQNDLARPAFTQELKYDLLEGRVIGFKGARFEVLSATNVGIKYKVLRHLD